MDLCREWKTGFRRADSVGLREKRREVIEAVEKDMTVGTVVSYMIGPDSIQLYSLIRLMSVTKKRG